MGPAALLLLLPALLLGFSAGEPSPGPGFFPLEGAALGSRSPPLSLEVLLEGADDLAVLRPGLLLGDLLELHLEPDCGELLGAFADGSVKLIGCLVRSARPVKVCQNCYRHYQQVKERLENITRVVGNTSETNPCAKSLLMSDRLQLVVLLSKFFTSTWNKANCANCLKNNSEGLSNSTIQFLALFNESLACFEHNLQGVSPPPSNYTEVCKNCNETYKKLNDMYNDMQKRELKHEAEEQAHLCIDVEDAMNITRRLWSTTFNCSVPVSDTVPVIAVSSFILFLPVVFYMSSFLHSKQKKRILILPKRIQSNASFANIQEKSH